MNLFIVFSFLLLGCITLIDSYTSYKKGVFKEYRKMAPYVYHNRGDKSFIPQILINSLLAIFMFGFSVWFWFKTS